MKFLKTYEKAVPPYKFKIEDYVKFDKKMEERYGNIIGDNIVIVKDRWRDERYETGTMNYYIIESFVDDTIRMGIYENRLKRATKKEIEDFIIRKSAEKYNI